MIDLSSEEASPRSGAGLPWWTATGEQVEAACPERGAPGARLLLAVLAAYLVAWLIAYAVLVAILRATAGS